MEADVDLGGLQVQDDEPCETYFPAGSDVNQADSHLFTPLIGLFTCCCRHFGLTISCCVCIWSWFVLVSFVKVSTPQRFFSNDVFWVQLCSLHPGSCSRLSWQWRPSSSNQQTELLLRKAAFYWLVDIVCILYFWRFSPPPTVFGIKRFLSRSWLLCVSRREEIQDGPIWKPIDSCVLFRCI